MRICPYVAFNGNCEEAVLFYEKAFNVKAEIMRYKDAPQEGGYQAPESEKNFIMHAQFEINGAAIMFCDMPGESPAKIGSNIGVMVEFDSEDQARAAFDVLKEGGKIDMEMQETFWSKCFGSLNDKFGIEWHISVVCTE